jgi:lipopolysaccharide transport system ATP-binding protein
MSSLALSVRNLSKRYRLGLKEEIPDSFAKVFGSWLVSPLASYRRLRRLSHFEDDNPAANGHPSDIIYALREVSFEVRKGEVIGIIGRNGAGKSTLLKILSRIVEPTTGRVEIYGRVASLLEVGTGFHPELTGRENIYLNGTILGMRKQEIDRKFDEIVAFSEIERFLDTPVKRYSSGMYVRLAFAVAAHLEPEILIVDEVLAVGDAEFQRKCLGKMKDVAGQGRTVLFVSHNMPTILALCESVVELREGEIRCIGKPEHVVANYLSTNRKPGRIDLAQFRVKGMGGEIAFQSMELCGDNASSVVFRSPICFDACITASRSLRSLSIGLSVFNSLGTCIGVTITEGDFSASAGQELKLRISIPPIALTPGAYYMGFSIGTGGKVGRRRDYDIIVGHPWFDVLPLTSDTMLANWQPSWGNILFEPPHLQIT